MTLTRNDNAPHVGVVGVEVHIYEKMKDGQLTGDPVHQVTRLYKVEGVDRHVCERKVNELLDNIRQGTSP